MDKRLVFVTGKGGVGKTTVAVALGLRAAAAGKRTIVCEVASQENASRMFDHTEVGFHEVEMEENLWSISIDPDESMREYVLLQLKVRAMRDMLFRSRIFNYLAAATPGLKELVTIGKIWELAQLDRKVRKGRKYDLVIVDAPATGHGIGFLQTPRTFANIARVGPIHAQAEELDRFITDHASTGAAIVSLPEEMPVNETATPTSSRRSCSSAADSLTGISSGRATIAVPVCSWSLTKRSISTAWAWIGPTRAMPAKVRGVCRKPIPCPVAGASTITVS